MKNETASISVIIPCYACEDTLHRAIRSVAEQSLKPKELLIISDGNTNCSYEKIKYLCKSLGKTAFEIIILKCDSNYGPGFARNIGWQMTSSEYIAFLDADDAWHPMKLEIQYGWMKKRSEVIATGHKSIEIQTVKDSIALPKQWPAYQVQPFRQLLSNRFHTRSVMVKKDCPFRFATTRRYSEDYQLWLEIILSKVPAWYLEIPLAFTFKAQYGASGLSGKLWKMEKGELASYYETYQKGLIPFLLFFALIPFSIIKFLKRVILSELRKKN